VAANNLMPVISASSRSVNLGNVRPCIYLCMCVCVAWRRACACESMCQPTSSLWHPRSECDDRRNAPLSNDVRLSVSMGRFVSIRRSFVRVRVTIKKATATSLRDVARPFQRSDRPW
jgi:hypothetical protein